MTASVTATRSVELESLGVVFVVDDDLAVVHAAESWNGFFEGGVVEDMIGQQLVEAIGEDADRMLRSSLSEGLERAGGWWPAKLPDGRRVKLRAYPVAKGLVGLDLLPVATTEATGADDATDAGSIERVAAWNDWLLACTSSLELLRAAAAITRERLGFDGVWVHRIEGDGQSVVVAAEVVEGAANLVGQSVHQTDVPPSHPRVRGRDVPFFVSDLGAPGVRLHPGAPELILEPSALLRPYPEYLERLASLGVRSTASLPIIVDGRLWGRVIAHHPAARRASAATQSELRLLSASVSARLAELIEQEDAREQVELARFALRLMGSVAASPDLIDGLVRDADDLRGVCAADGAIVAIGDRVELAGIEGDPSQIDALLQMGRAALEQTVNGTVWASVSLDGTPGIDRDLAAGYLAVRLGRTAQDIILWLRRESTRAVTWIEHQVVGDTFADELFTGVTLRRELASGTCTPWTSAQIAQADEVREAIGQVLIARYSQVQALNAELERSNEEYDAFAHAAAHDLKAPLRGIRQFVEFHLEDTQDRLTAAEQEQMVAVTRMVSRMHGLLDDLMAYAQVGKAEWNPKPVPVEEAVADAFELLGPTAVRCSVTVEPTTFTTDPVALRQILLNLIGNAIKYTDGPATVTVGVTTLEAAEAIAPAPSLMQSAAPSTPVLVVSDEGMGIDPDHHERVFGLFHQLDPKADGTGAGLAMCRLICRRHGGDIWLRSAPGEGTTFLVATGA